MNNTNFNLSFLAQQLGPNTQCQTPITPTIPADPTTTPPPSTLTPIQNLMATTYFKRLVCKGDPTPLVLQMNPSFVVFIEDSYYGVVQQIGDLIPPCETRYDFGSCFFCVPTELR